MPLASELVQSCTSVFTLPEIYSRVRDVVDDSNSTMEDLANAFKLDPALSVRLLRIANSPQYGAPKQIDTITHGINLIGIPAVKDLVAETTVGRTFPGCRFISWTHSSFGARASSVRWSLKRWQSRVASTTVSDFCRRPAARHRPLRALPNSPPAGPVRSH
ncbi:MAG: HDOD domain-containing protein [Nitrospiraceae bacterium]|nr:HDOD domain-containing protein [Nitrospiraceae bacterium]